MTQNNSSTTTGSSNTEKSEKNKIKLRELFDKFDVDKDGGINRQELKNGFKLHGVDIHDEQISKMFEIADSNRDHKIEWEEFFGTLGGSESQELEDIAEYWLSKPGMTRMVVSPPTSQQKRDPIPSWKLLLSGGVAGAISRTCTSPLERLKILNQVQFLKLEADSSKYKGGNGVIRSLITMWKTEGFSGFFKGNGTNVIRIAPYSAIQFLSYEKYKNMVMSYNSKNYLTTYENLIVGGCAGVTSLLCTYPLDLIRSRLTVQVHSTKYNGISNTFRTIVAEEGYRGLYKGLVTSAVGVAPYVAINFTTYENLKKFLMKDKTPSVIESLAFGAISGATAQTLTYPIDLIRRRLQVQGIGGQDVRYTGLLDAMNKIVKEEGFRGLYNGMVPCYLKVIPAISISFCVYEVMKSLLKIDSNKVSYST